MRRGIGRANQIGYIVEDIDKALDYWINVMGVGPWFVTRNMTLDDYIYRGKPSTCTMHIAVANSGDVQIELVQDLNEGPSWYKDCLAQGRVGINHVSFWQNGNEEYDETYKKLIDSGFTPAHSGSHKGGRFAYFENPEHPGVVIEISAMVGNKAELFKKVADLAKNWDGKDPIR